MPLNFRYLALALTSAFLLSGCAIPHVPSRIVYEDPVNFVRLEQDAGVLAEWPPSHHTHPVSIEPGKLREVLSGLKVREHRIALQRWILGGESPLVPAFTDEELDLLSVQLSEAMAQAKYSERVTFYLSQPQTFARRTITTGGLYVQGTELHILLGNWRILYGIPAYGMIYDRRYPMRPTAAKGFDLIFQPSEAVIPMKSSLLDGILANAKDELIIDLTKLDPPDPEVSFIKRKAYRLSGQKSTFWVLPSVLRRWTVSPVLAGGTVASNTGGVGAFFANCRASGSPVGIGNEPGRKRAALQTRGDIRARRSLAST